MYRGWRERFKQVFSHWLRFPMTDLQTITDGRGKLVVIEKLDFDIKRVYFLRDVTQTRGGHAHRKCRRMMIAVNGSFNLTMNNADGYRDLFMQNPSKGQIIEPLTWCELTDFSPDAICLVLASQEHDEADIIRDYQEFKELIRK